MIYTSVEQYLRDWPEGVTGGKGQDVAQAQLNTQNQLVQTQLAQQKAVQDQMQGAFSKYLSGNIGFSPQQMSMLQSQFMNQNTGAFNAAGSNVRSSMAARGSGNGDLPVGGDYTRGIAELEGAKASSQSQGLLGLGVQNAQQAISNQFNSGSLIQGQAAQLGQNIGVFNQGAGGALNSYITGVNAPGWMSGLAGIAGSAAAGFAGGFGQSLGKKVGGP
jgi:hypothetical protein